MSVVTSADLLGTLEALARRGAGLSVEANLQVTVDGTPLAVSSVGDSIRVQVPSLWAALALGRTERDRLAALSTVLAQAGLTAEIRVGDAVVAILGADASPGPLARALSLGAVESSGRELLAAALRVK